MRQILIAILASVCVACMFRSASYDEARAVVDRRCLPCHAAKPTSRAFPVAPQAVMFDTPAEMQKYAARIKATVVDGSMPLANLTNMTRDERRVLSRWVDLGAKIH